MQSITFHEAVATFLPWAKVNYRSKPNTYKRIKTSLSSALVFFNKSPVNAIDAAGLDDYKTWRATEHEVRDVTIRHDLHALSTFFQYAIRHHWASSNPIREITIPSDAESQRMHVLGFQQEEEYFGRARRNPNLHDLALLIINQGLRPEEATALKKENVNFTTGKIYVSSGKTKAAQRYLDMTSAIKTMLAARMAGPSQWIFPSNRRPGSHIGRLNSVHDRIVAEAAKHHPKVSFHVTQPLGLDEKIAQVIIKRITDCDENQYRCDYCQTRGKHQQQLCQSNAYMCNACKPAGCPNAPAAAGHGNK